MAGPVSLIGPVSGDATQAGTNRYHDWVVTQAVPVGTFLWTGWAGQYTANYTGATTTDARGNTWTTSVTQRGSTYGAYQVYCKVTTALQVGDRIRTDMASTSTSGADHTLNRMYAFANVGEVIITLSNRAGESALALTHYLERTGLSPTPVIALAVGVWSLATASPAGVTPPAMTLLDTRSRTGRTGLTYYETYPTFASTYSRSLTTTTSYNGLAWGLLLTAASVNGGSGGTVSVSGGGDGIARRYGSSGGVVTASGAGDGRKRARGAAGGSVTAYGAGAGRKGARGAGAGVLPVYGAGAGVAHRRGGTGGVVTVPGGGGGIADVFPEHHTGGSGGTIVLTGHGGGFKSVRRGSGGTVPVYGSGDGLSARSGGTGGQLILRGAGAGLPRRRGSSSGRIAVQGAGRGRTSRRAGSSGVIAVTGAGWGARNRDITLVAVLIHASRWAGKVQDAARHAAHVSDPRWAGKIETTARHIAKLGKPRWAAQRRLP